MLDLEAKLDHDFSHYCARPPRRVEERIELFKKKLRWVDELV